MQEDRICTHSDEISCVIMIKVINLYDPLFLHLQNGNKVILKY